MCASRSRRPFNPSTAADITLLIKYEEPNRMFWHNFVTVLHLEHYIYVKFGISLSIPKIVKQRE
jgi:hypothetical protein